MNARAARHPRLREFAEPLTPGVDGMELVVARPRWSSRGLVAHVSVRRHFLDADEDTGAFENTHDVPLGTISLTSMSDRQTLTRTLVDMLRGEETFVDGVDPEKLLWTIGYLFAAAINAETDQHRSVQLNQVPLSTSVPYIDVEGLRLAANHATIIFGDGETAKSTLALWLAGQLTLQGQRVLYLDWELSEVEHRQRLGQLFGSKMPDGLRYLHCTQPLSELVEVVRAQVEEHRITFLVIDSIAYAISGEAVEQGTATGFFRDLQDIGAGIGSLLIAHTPKSAHKGDDGTEKPFGSVFWHNSARATYLIEQTDRTDTSVEVELSPRKANLWARTSDVTMAADFEDGGCVLTFRPTNGNATTVSDQVLAAVRTNPEGLRKAELLLILAGVKRKTLDKTLERMTKKPDHTLTLSKNAADDWVYTLRSRGGVRGLVAARVAS